MNAFTRFLARRPGVLLLLLALAVAAGLAGAEPASAQLATPTLTGTPTPSQTFTPRPTLRGTPTATLVPGPDTYTVQPGDQLLRIAQRFGITLDALRVANRLSDDVIYPGQVLRVPTPVPTAKPPTAAPGQRTYVVQPGDQLLRIAQQFGVTAEAIRAANRLRGDVIVPGQVLLIPAPAPAPTPVPGQAYIVQPGDQLLRIAQRFGVTAAAIRSANRLTTDVLWAGQALIIPAPTAAVPTGTLAPGSLAYVVQRGDRLARIAAWYGVTVAAIQKANNLRTDTVQPDQVIVVPNPVTRPAPYIVQSGDTLTSLSARFGVPIETIKLANGMLGDTILRGLTLIIPMR